MKKAIFYTNQFFGQIGGEEKTDLPPVIKEGAVGPAASLQERLKETVIAATVICGDNYYVENMDKARGEILRQISDIKPDLVIAGPAFNAGRFGMACGDLCESVEKELQIPALTGMYEENPAVTIYRAGTTMVKTGKSAASMKDALDRMGNLINVMMAGGPVDSPESFGMIPKGVRINVFKEKTGAERALDMLVAKLQGSPYQTEIPLPTYDEVTAAPPVKDLSLATVALITSGGIVPQHNPDRLPAATAKHYCVYDISGITALTEGEYESVHAGYDPVMANKNPNRIVPIDLMRELEKSGRIGKLHPYFYSTTGNSTSVADATRMGREMAVELKKSGVSAVVMTST